MSIFGKKVKEETKKGEINNIKVLGTGCRTCHAQLENVKKAVEEMNLSAEVEYITDMEKIMEYGVMSMPAIVVNERVVATGKLLKDRQVRDLLGGLDGE